MPASNDRSFPPNRQTVGKAWISWFSEVVVLRSVRLILAFSLFTTLVVSPAVAQSGTAPQTIKPVDPPGHDPANLYYLGNFSSAKDLNPHSSLCGAFGLVGKPPIRLPEASGKAISSPCDTVVDAVAGSREFGPDDMLSLPGKITSDSKGRIIVADRGVVPSIHIFDFDGRKHSRITGGRGRPLRSPAGLAVDGHDRLYVTDAQLGTVLVYDSNGKFRRHLGKRRGERLFERPAGIAVDPASGHIYVADPPRNVVVMLDAGGNILARFGTSTGRSGPAEFAEPTDVVIRDKKLFVLDTQNYRIQVFDLAGNFNSSIQPESMEPSQGFAIDNIGRIYLDGPQDTIRVLQPDGRLIFEIGSTGSGHGEFRGPSGIWTDRLDRIFVADTGNHRVQSFEWGIEHVAKLPHP